MRQPHWLTALGIAVMVFLTLCFLLVKAGGTEISAQYAVMVFDHRCLSNIAIKPTTTVEAPMVDGQPDLKHSAMKGASIDIDMSCGHVEIRKNLTN